MVFSLRRILATSLAVLSVLGAVACGPRRGAPLPSDPLLGSPPVAKDGEVHRVELDLEGGNLAAAETITISLAAPVARLETFPDGFRLSVSDPALAGTAKPHAWGFWLFADGDLREEAFLEVRTGTQLVMDGISWAPGAKPKTRPKPSNHVIDATLQITRFEPERGIFEADFSAPLLAPDGKTTLMAKGMLSLPWPSAGTSATSP